jgi:hypothetical protein
MSLRELQSTSRDARPGYGHVACAHRAEAPRHWHMRHDELFNSLGPDSMAAGYW